MKRYIHPLKHFYNIFSKKSIIFCDFPLLRLGKSMCIAIQNMTKPPKQIFKYIWHSKKFSF